VSQDAHAANHFGNPSYGGATFSDVEAANAVVFTSPSASEIYLDEVTNDFDEVQQVSIQGLVVDNRY
jgi:hypothetical protein